MTTKEVISPVNTKARKELGIKSGDTVKVTQKIKEKGKVRLQIFEGIVLSVKHGTEPGATFTVRKVASGVGVEKTFPLYSLMVDKIEIVKRTKVRRAKLYYIRKKAAKEIRRAMRKAFIVGDTIESDIAEKERLAKEAEKKATEEAEAKKQEEATADKEESKEESKKTEDEKVEEKKEENIKEEEKTEEKEDKKD